MKTNGENTVKVTTTKHILAEPVSPLLLYIGLGVCFCLFHEKFLQIKKTIPPSSFLSSFEPELISEFEEKDRLTSLGHRDFLIKSYGLLEQIYMSMKRNNALRPADKRKYGSVFDKIESGNEEEISQSSSTMKKRQNFEYKCSECKSSKK